MEEWNGRKIGRMMLSWPVRGGMAEEVVQVDYWYPKASILTRLVRSMRLVTGGFAPLMCLVPIPLLIRSMAAVACYCRPGW